MDKLEAAIKRVERYEAKISIQTEILKNLGANPLDSWKNHPDGSAERIAAVEIMTLERDLDRAKQALLKRKNIESKKTDKGVNESKGKANSSNWMKSKTGMWHKVGFEIDTKKYPSCQSYNLDRPNALYGEAFDIPPENERVCKKCKGANSGKGWTHIK
ncbi:hypothetical protein [Paenibacillus sp. Marseille-Q4541]|uniref:hypothetical protein n=1 Tax=Paenibacillus sp. Marseille-Q4541 TaxID=2831522 RepID=UPI001BA5F54E|nr:hypothetical protein [Paenibacillus sp. Marseille-Q4541]